MVAELLKYHPESLSQPTLAREIIEAAHLQHESLRGVDRDTMLTRALQTLGHMSLYEQAARKPLTLEPSRAARIKGVFVFSGPGTFFDDYKENDPYRDDPWAAGMDRQRLLKAAELVRVIHERSLGRSTPFIFYNGLAAENKALREALATGAYQPGTDVHIQDHPGIKRTIDQVQLWELPQGLLQPGDILGVLSHAAHLPRGLRMFNRYPTLPTGVELQTFPLPTPDDGLPGHQIKELRGAFHYEFNTQEASPTPYPHTVQMGTTLLHLQ